MPERLSIRYASRAASNSQTDTGNLSLGESFSAEYADLRTIVARTGGRPQNTALRYFILTGIAAEWGTATVTVGGLLTGRRPVGQIIEGRILDPVAAPIPVTADDRVYMYDPDREADFEEIISQLETDLGRVRSLLRDAEDSLRRTKHLQTLTIGGSDAFFYPVWWQWPVFRDGAYNLEIVNDSAYKILHLKLQGVLPHPEHIHFSMKVDMIRESRLAQQKYVSHVSAGMYLKDVSGNRLAAWSYYPTSERYSGLYLRGNNRYRLVKDWPGDVSSFVGAEEARHIVVSRRGQPQFYVDRIAYSARRAPRVGG